jgi:hypothetical protein
MGIHMRSLRVALGMTLALALGLGLASCNDDDNNGNRTITKVAMKEISQNTAEDSDPIQINDLTLSNRDTDETGLPDAL